MHDNNNYFFGFNFLIEILPMIGRLTDFALNFLYVLFL